MTDRFRPDAALRGIIPFDSAPAVRVFAQSGGQIIDALSPPTYRAKAHNQGQGDAKHQRRG